MRVTFTCDDFEHIGLTARDQRVKLVIPPTDAPLGDFGQADPAQASQWYANWRTLPEHQRGSMRTFTIRNPNPTQRTIDVDFVLHGAAGPASAWVMQAQPGDDLVIVAPDERSEHSTIGSDWHPGTAGRMLIVGDETAAPAIAGIIERLPASAIADVFIEVPTAADALDITTTASVETRWLDRADAEHGAPLMAAVRAWALANSDLLDRAAAPRPQVLENVDVDTDLLWESPGDAEGDFYAWIAGEAMTVKSLRRLLVSERGVDRKRVAFMGYWRHGVAERQA